MIELGFVWSGLFVVVVIYGQYTDDYNDFDEDKAGYWFRDWFAMSRNMTLLVRNMTSLGLYE